MSETPPKIRAAARALARRSGRASTEKQVAARRRNIAVARRSRWPVCYALDADEALHRFDSWESRERWVKAGRGRRAVPRSSPPARRAIRSGRIKDHRTRG